MEENSKIGFFDSGVGGLSVYSRFKNLFPYTNTIYYGDLKNLPYGNKTQEQLVGFARNILDFFSEQEVKAVVIACNTSSALADEKIKNDYDFKIYPIIQSCAKVISEMEIEKLGVFATPATVGSGAYTKEINKYNPKIQVKEVACPNWVSIVEGINGCEDDIKICFDEMIPFDPEKVILGCTHYPYLIKRLSNYLPKDLFIDPAKIFVDYIAQDLNLISDKKEIGTEEFFVSAKQKEFFENSKLFYQLKNLPKLDISNKMVLNV